MKNKDSQITAVSHGTCQIVEAGSRGAAGSISLKAEVSAEPLEKGIKCTDPIAKDIASKVLEFFGCDCGLKIHVENSIPENLGFGKKEAVAAATSLAVAGVLARKSGSINELKVDKYMRDQFLIIDGKLVDKKDLIDICLDSGMRLDRIYPAFYGGFSVADNNKKEVLRHGEMETLHAIILSPKKPEKTNLKDMMTFEPELKLIWQEALKGNLNTAMKTHAAIYGRETAKIMVSAGALAVSASREGGWVAFTRDEEKVSLIQDSIKDLGEVLVGEANNEKARILTKPKKIYKIQEFMELKKDQEYHWL